MAIYSAVPPPDQAPPASTSQPQSQEAPSGTVDIEAWTISALESLSVSAPLSIPLDSSSSRHGKPPASASGTRVTIAVDDHAEPIVTPPRRPRTPRDSMKRRDALLKGREGSRQRRRWDNARLADVPNVEPPLPSDWEPRPTHVVRHIPYHVASYWDRGLREQVEERKSYAARKKRAEAAGKVPRDLREKVKKTPGVKSWLRALEEPVRQFLVEQGIADEKESEVEDSEDDEIVFVGRNVSSMANGGGKQDSWRRAHIEVCEKSVDTGMVFDSLEDDESGAFKRWLSHSISDFYGLDSRSVTMGNPSRRCVYIGVRRVEARKVPQMRSELPRPLWELLSA